MKRFIMFAMSVVTAAFLVASISGNVNAAFEKPVDFPKGTISLVVPAGPGGGTDLSARTFAKYAAKIFKQNIVVLNVTGGGGSNGTKKVFDAKPDGATVLFFHNNVILNNLSGVAPYSVDGFEVGPRFVTDAAVGLFVNAKNGPKDMPEFIKLANENPGKLKVATEIGGYTYFFLLTLKEATGITFNMVDVGGNAEKSTALLGGHIDAMPNSFGTAQGYVKSGDFRCLGFPIKERSSVFPDVPTCTEQGVNLLYPAYEFSMFFPKGTPESVIKAFDDAAKMISEDQQAYEDIKKLGFQLNYMERGQNAKDYAEMEALYKKLADNVKK